MAHDDHQSAKGLAFEERVFLLLDVLARSHPSQVKLERHPQIVLQNEEVVIPDLVLTIRLPHEVAQYLIECQDRGKFSKNIIHKIQHVRSKSPGKTFFFIYPKVVPLEVARTLDGEGIMHASLKEFKTFVHKLSLLLTAIRKNCLDLFMGDSPPVHFSLNFLDIE